MHRFLTPLLFTGGVSFYIVLLARIQALLRQGFGIPSAKTNTENVTLKAPDKTQLAHRYDTVVAKWSPSPQGTL